MSKIRKSVIDNGMKIITEEMADLESATLGIWVKTGSRFESAELGGISHFIEHLLFKGTEKRSAYDISHAIESVGGVLNAFTGREYTCFYVKVLNKDLPLAIDLLSDIFTNSIFDPKEISREKMVVLQEIRMVEDTPDDLIHDLFVETLWKDDAMGRPVLGRRKTVKKITRNDIKRYMAGRYRPENVFVTATGKIKHAKVVKAVTKALGPMGKGRVAGRRKKPATSAGLKLVKRDLEQVHFCLGVPALNQSDKRRYAIYLLNTLLGGGMSSRLFQEIREKRGLAYSVYSYLNLSADTGSMTVYAGTTADKFKDVLSLVMAEFDKLGTISEKELRSAKDHLKGGMLLGLESGDSRMMKLAKDEMYFKRVVPISEITKGIDAVSVRDLVSMAGKLFKPERMTLAAIGNVRRSDLPGALK